MIALCWSYMHCNCIFSFFLFIYAIGLFIFRFYEIQQFSPTLRPLRYMGPTKERQSLRKHLSGHDVVITSYEVIRNEVFI